MRTFHYGGTAATVLKRPQIEARVDGFIKLIDARTVISEQGHLVVLNKSAKVSIIDVDGFEQETQQLIPGAQISKRDGDKVKKGEVFVVWDPYNVPIITEHGGRVKFVDLVEGITMKEQSNERGNTEITVLDHRDDLMPQILIIDDAAGDENMLAHYSIPTGAFIMVENGQSVDGGEVLARTPRQSARTKDITGGLPRVAELFEARRPKEAAEIARIDGAVELGKVSKGKRLLIIRDPENNSEEEHSIPAAKQIVVFDDELVKKGQALTEGSVVPQEILEVCGPQDLQEYLVNEIQEVYRLQGVEINDKHIEVIVRQMLQKVRITDPGDTTFLYGEQIEKSTFLEENTRVLGEVGGRPAEAQPILLGITKASLETDSFISAASFQDTTRILTDAATLGKEDPLRGFKENVIMGHLIPAGTGYHKRLDIKLKKLGREIVPEPEELRDESPAVPSPFAESPPEEESRGESEKMEEAIGLLGLDS